MEEVKKQGRFYARCSDAPAMLAGKKRRLREYLHDGLVTLGIDPGFVV